MKLFISSVRRGLEEERDALPGLVHAVGHVPLRFEDYSAQPVPSREACLAGVAAADAYLLLLGPNYGHEFADTGQSPTHDEWVAAQARGLPRLVYRKDGVEFEPEQEVFVQSISDYATGVFYDTFSSTSDLLTKVAARLRELESAADPLTFTPLTAPVEVSWRPPDQNSGISSDPAAVEVYVLGVPAPSRRPSRVMSELAQKLPGRLRASEAVDPAKAIDTAASDDVVEARMAFERGGYGPSLRSPQLLGVRLGADGQVVTWASLPGDGMGAVLDEADLAIQIASLLRLTGQLKVIQSAEVAVAVAISGANMLSVGSVAQLPRSSASMVMNRGEALRVEPDEAMSQAALDVGAAEVGRTLAAALVRRATDWH